MNQTIQTPQHRETDSKPTQESLGKLHDREVQLLNWLRTRWRFGEVTIMVRDGVPYRAIRAFESKDFE